MIHNMPLDKITDRDGRWYLRRGFISESEDIYITVVSNFAPQGTVARDLKAETLEVSTDTDDDHLSLPVYVLRDLLQWPSTE